MTNLLSKLTIALATTFTLVACGPAESKTEQPLTCEEAGCGSAVDLACTSLAKPGETQTCICKVDPSMPVECTRVVQ